MGVSIEHETVGLLSMNSRDSHLYTVLTSGLWQLVCSFPGWLAALVRNSRETRLGIYTRHQKCVLREGTAEACTRLPCFVMNHSTSLGRAAQETVGSCRDGALFGPGTPLAD